MNPDKGRSREDCLLMVALVEEGVSQKAVGKRFGCSGTRVAQIVAREKRREQQRQKRLEHAKRLAAAEKGPRALPLELLELSGRAKNVAMNQGLYLLGDLADVTKRQALEFRNSGMQTVREFEDVLKEYGLAFKPAPRDACMQTLGRIRGRIYTTEHSDEFFFFKSLDILERAWRQIDKLGEQR